jgi:hypothetical protein
MLSRKTKEGLVIASTAIGSLVELVECGLFSSIAAAKLPTLLFKPLGIGMLATSAAGPLIEDDKVKKGLRLIGYLPSIAANVAIFFYEGPIASAIFTATVCTSGALLLAEVAYKKNQHEPFSRSEQFELSMRFGKLALIGLTLNLGGTGKVFELISEGKNVNLEHQICSGAVGAIAAIGGFFGMYKTQKLVRAKQQAVIEEIKEPEYQVCP